MNIDDVLSGPAGWPGIGWLVLSTSAEKALAEQLRGVLPVGAGVGECRLREVRSKPRRKITANYEASTGTVSSEAPHARPVAATWAKNTHAARREETAALARMQTVAVRRRVAAPFERLLGHSCDGTVRVSVSPLDARFTQLVRFSDPRHICQAAMRAEVAASQPERGGEYALTSLKCCPGKTHTVSYDALDSAGDRVFAKLCIIEDKARGFRRDDAAPCRVASDSVWLAEVQDGGHGLRPLTYLDEDAVVAHAQARGTPLSDYARRRVDAIAPLFQRAGAAELVERAQGMLSGLRSKFGKPLKPASLKECTMKLRYLFPLILLLLVLLIPNAVNAQNQQTVKGELFAPDASPVPGVNVLLTGETLDEPRSSETDEEGMFEFSKVLPGNYILRVEVPGFEPLEKPIAVGSEPIPRIRLKLKIAAVSDKVTVSGQSVLLAEENRSQVRFDERMVMNLPVRDADPLAVPSLFLNSAVVGSSGPTIIVDGVETSSLDLPISSVKSVTVDQNPYSPEFGRPGKGRLEVTTRRGVHSRYRGNVLALFRNSALDARNAMAVERPVQQRAIGEVQLDGPLTLSEQTTFFVAGRYHVFNNSAVVDATTPAGLIINNIATPGGTFVGNVGVPERTTSLFARVDSHFLPTHRLSLFYKLKNEKLDNQGVGGLDLPDRGTDFFEHENELKAIETATPSSNFQNQVRLTYRHVSQSTTSVSNDPAVIVLGAFNFGGAQTDRKLIETLGDMQDMASLFYGRHNLRFGTGVKLRYFSAEDSSNFGGTFIFSSLADFQSTPTPRPSEFIIKFGSPSVDFQDHHVFSFLQDQVRLRPDLSVMAGLRYEFQPEVSHYQNLAPRLAVAYSPKGNRILADTVFRGGFGIFYDRQPYLMQQDSLLDNGSAIRRIVLSCPSSCPSYPNALPPGNASTSVARPSIITTDPNIRFPYLMQGSLAIERKLGRGQNYLTVELSTLRGVDLYRSRNINAPLPGTITPPNPNFVNIDQFEASGSSQSNSLSVTYKGNFHKLNVMAQYVLSRTLDDVNDGTNGYLYTPANNYNPHGDWGRSALDRRHRFNTVLLYPWRFGLHVSGIVNVWSGLPYNITTGTDDNHDTVFNDRPPGLWRNAGRAAGYTDVDLRLTKHWRVFRQREHAHFVDVSWDAFNVFNHVNFDNYNGVLSSPTFGQPHTAYPARQFQASVRYHF